MADSLQATLGQPEPKTCRLVRDLYDALNTRDVDRVHSLVAPDLEWWFHGPPSHQFLMRLLTGTASSEDQNFAFVPLNITSVGPIVLAEGCDQVRRIYWAHAWTVSDKDGVITQVREYFNTSLTVTRIGDSISSSSSSSSTSASDSEDSTAEIVPAGGGSRSDPCTFVWESSLANRVGKAVPGLILAI